MRRPAASPAPAALSGAVAAWFRRHRRDLPWRRRRDPYRVWVSEIMLQQTTVKTVVPYFERFMRRFPSVAALARARPAAVLAAWSGLGYYRRARHLHQAARLVVERHGGRLPGRSDALLALPGIGRYTCGAILSLAFGRAEPILDGNVARVLCRLLGERRDPRRPEVTERLWRAARRLVEAARSPGGLNEGLMELGATLCTPADPDCARCPLRRACRARAGGYQERVPPPRRLRPPVRQRRVVGLVERDGRLLMRRRRATGLMDGLWEFPEVAARGPRGRTGPPALEPLERLGVVRHTITFRRIEVTVRRARLRGEPRAPEYRFIAPARLRRLAVSSLVRKILDCASVPG